MADAAATKKEKAVEFNPRFKGYVFIALTSLVNFASIANISRFERATHWAATMIFGVVTFSISILVLVQDRTQRLLETFHYTKANDGYFEGVTLLLLVLWWIVGTGYLTRAGGIAYVASNIYFSSWLALFSCIYTLDEWSASKDILSIAELTRLSATLKSWWVVTLSSLVVTGTSIDLHVRLAGDDLDDTSFAIAIGFFSLAISLFFLLVHYDFFPKCEEGGWMELCSSFLLVTVWTIGLAFLTKDNGAAATMSGSQCTQDSYTIVGANCSIVVMDNVGGELVERDRFSCNSLRRQVPGSNLYFAAWTCFFASVNVAFRWKAAQAITFAQAQQEKHQRRLRGTTAGGSDEQGSDDEDDEDDI